MIKDQCGTVNIGYFLGDNYTLKSTLYAMTDGDYEKTNMIRRELRKSGGYTANNVRGYDQYIVLGSNTLGIEDGEFSVAEDAKKGQIAREFTKYTRGKRVSRVLLDKFVQAVA